MDQIISNLYLGDINGASDKNMLKKNGVTHILQVAAGFHPFFPGEFRYKIVNVLDMPFENLQKHFTTAIEFMRQAISSGGTVLVHCYAGISRSSSVVIAYLMQQHEMSLFDAMSLTRKKRPIIHPNPGFQKQLFDYEKKLKQMRLKVINEATIKASSPMRQVNNELFGQQQSTNSMMPPPRPTNKFIQMPKTSNQKPQLPKPYKSSSEVLKAKDGDNFTKNQNQAAQILDYLVQPVLKEKKKTDSLADIAQTLYEQHTKQFSSQNQNKINNSQSMQSKPLILKQSPSTHTFNKPLVVIPESENSSKNDYYEMKVTDYKKPPLSQSRPFLDKIEPKRNLLIKSGETFDAQNYHPRESVGNRDRISQKNKVLSPQKELQTVHLDNQHSPQIINRNASNKKVNTGGLEQPTKKQIANQIQNHAYSMVDIQNTYNKAFIKVQPQNTGFNHSPYGQGSRSQAQIRSLNVNNQIPHYRKGSKMNGSTTQTNFNSLKSLAEVYNINQYTTNSPSVKIKHKSKLI